MEKTKNGIQSKLNKILMVGAAVLALNGLTADQASAATTADITVNAEVVAAISIVATTAMEFGQFVAGGAGTIVVDQADGRIKTGALNALIGGAGATSAVVTVTGDNGSTASFSVATGNISSVDPDTIAFSLPTVASNVAMTGAGVAVPIGGTLTVDGTEAINTYTGTFTVTAAYD